jgi:hypothetical protein
MATTDTPTPPTGPQAVSRFEFNLLRLLRFVLGHMPPEQATNYLSAKLPCPPCLSEAAVKLAEDTIAKALVLHLVRAGGWRAENHLRDGKPNRGRVWERIPLGERELAFSRHPLAFMMWLTAERVTDTKEPWDVPAGALTPADELFFAVAFDNLRAEPNVAGVLAEKRAFRDNPLCWLTGGTDFATPGEVTPPSFEPLTSGVRAVIVECLNPELARRWIKSERGRGQIGDWKQMRATGTALNRTLTDFLAACGKANRPDLARFVLTAARAILNQPGLTPQYWTGGLQGNGPPRLADRLETQRAAVVLPRHLPVLQGWDRKARGVGYWDDDYAASQLWKEDWEAANGNELAATAHRILELLEPLRA